MLQTEGRLWAPANSPVSCSLLSRDQPHAGAQTQHLVRSPWGGQAWAPGAVEAPMEAVRLRDGRRAAAISKETWQELPQTALAVHRRVSSLGSLRTERQRNGVCFRTLDCSPAQHVGRRGLRAGWAVCLVGGLPWSKGTGRLGHCGSLGPLRRARGPG